MFKTLLLVTTLCSTALLSSCNEHGNENNLNNSSPQSKVQQPIVIQGALPIETEYLAKKLNNVQEETIGGWKFWKGTYQGYPVIISKTRMGMSNSAAATAIAITQYKPIAIINQGTSGGHDPTLKVYDIVLGKYSTNIGAIRTPFSPLGGGSNALKWNEAYDVLPDDESQSGVIAIRKFEADAKLLEAAQRVKSSYKKGQVVEGTIGSADVWNNELDRIALFNKSYGTSVEEMESASVAQIASQFKVPYIGIRVLSNNITNNGAYDPKTGDACQEYVLNVAVEYMKNQSAKVKNSN